MAKKIIDEIQEEMLPLNKVKIAVDLLNVREAPNSFGRIVSTVHKGETFDVLGESNGYVCIGEHMWVVAQFVKGA